MNTVRFENKGAFVTGGGSGIGRATAKRLAKEGASVYVTDVREESAEQVAIEIRNEGGKATSAMCDVADERSVEAAFATASQSVENLCVLVSAAGIVDVGETHELDLSTWEHTMRVNLTGSFLVCKYALRVMLGNGGGSIVTVGSVASVVARKGGTSSPAYAASKGGVLQLTRKIAVGYAEQNVRANCVAPGSIATSLHENSGMAEGQRTSGDWLYAPISRRADPDEVATAICFLASDEASFITGSIMMVDGGLTAI